MSARTIFVTNEDRLTAYANGKLSQTETAQFEQIIGEMLVPSTTIVEGEQVTRGAVPLSKPILLAIQNRIKNGHPTTPFNLPKREQLSEALLELSSQPDSGAVKKVLQAHRSADGTLPRALLGSSEFNATLLNSSGGIDLSSESWRMLPTQIYKPGVNYDLARGLATFPARVATVFSEVARDVTGGRVSSEGQMIYQADNDFNALRTLTMGTLTDAVANDRVLKSVQDQINKVLAPLEPGVFKFDAKARAALTSVSGMLASALSSEVAILPEYGGSPSQYSNAQISAARKTARELRNLLAEYVQFGDQMDSFLSGSRNAGGTVGTPTDQEKKNILYKAAEDQNKEKE